MNKDEGLDRARIEQLAAEILAPIRANYLAGPQNRDRVYEALNALAYAVALVIAGTGDETGDAKAFFEQAFLLSVKEVQKRFQ